MIIHPTVDHHFIIDRPWLGEHTRPRVLAEGDWNWRDNGSLREQPSPRPLRVTAH